MKKTQKGFTLVELLVVIAILAILSTVAVVGYTSFINRAEKQAAETEMAQIETVINNALIINDEVKLTLTDDTGAVTAVLYLTTDGTNVYASEAGTSTEDIAKDLGDVVEKLTWDGDELTYTYEDGKYTKVFATVVTP